MNVILLSVLLIFESIQKTALVNFMMILNIFKVSKISFWTFWKRGWLSIYWTLFFLKTVQSFYNRTMQTKSCGTVLLETIVSYYPQYPPAKSCAPLSGNQNNLQTPSPPFPLPLPFALCVSRHISNSLSVYLCLCSKL